MANDPVTAALAEIRKRQEVTFADPAGKGRPDLLLAVKVARDDIPRLLAALDAVLAPHAPRPAYGSPGGLACGYCTDAGGTVLLVTWPCQTRKVILAALTGGTDHGN